MLLFRKIRKMLGLTQRQMAEACEVPRSTWQMVEYGAFLPSEELGRKICELTGMAGVPTRGDLLSTQDTRRVHRSRPYEFERRSEDVWARTRARCQSMHGLFGKIEAGLLGWMESLLECESVPEGFTWLQFAFSGAGRLIANPHELGFRDQVIVDRQGRALGERQLPGLQGNWGRLNYLLWPQVSVRPQSAILRLDGLLLLIQGVERRWFDLEVDSALHEPERDAVRRNLLQMNEIRLTQEDVDRFRAVERIVNLSGNFFRESA
ncbi:MAG: helix-turn-helix transcriptional regulator [Vulcanimicrobiota bacterium]